MGEKKTTKLIYKVDSQISPNQDQEHYFSPALKKDWVL